MLSLKGVNKSWHKAKWNGYFSHQWYFVYPFIINNLFKIQDRGCIAEPQSKIIWGLTNLDIVGIKAVLELPSKKTNPG